MSYIKKKKDKWNSTYFFFLYFIHTGHVCLQVLLIISNLIFTGQIFLLSVLAFTLCNLGCVANALADEYQGKKRLIKTLRNTVPSTNPWGTPLITHLHPGVEPLTTTLWVWSHNQFLILWTVHLSNPCISNSERKMLWGNMSKTLPKTRYCLICLFACLLS